MPVVPDPRPRLRHAFRFGVFDERGRIVRASLLFRSYAQMGFAAKPEAPTRWDPRPVIFAGHLSQHFGHFLLESLSRLWFTVRQPDLPVVWACRAEPPAPSLAGWQREILDALGIANEVLLLTEPTRFAGVHVPQPGYRVQDHFAPQQAAFLAVHPARPRDPSLHLWLSRAALDAGFGSVHAARLDRQLAEHGWTVIAPEQLPVREQLDLLARAARVAGEEGSAFHLLALLEDVSGLEVDIIYRDPTRPADRQNGNYQTIAQARGLQQRLHAVPEERVLAVERGHVRKLATTLATHLEMAGIPRSAAVTPSPRPLARLVNAVATAIGAHGYLEVGSGIHGLWPDVEVATRHVVRPAFAIDPRGVREPGLELFEMPAADYFDHLAEPSQAFDLIVLDEPASAEESAAWMEATGRQAGSGTIWIVRSSPAASLAAETLPADPFGELRSAVVASDEGPCTLFFGPSVSLDQLPAS